MVGQVGFEPTQPKATDLQSAATLPLRRYPILWWAARDLNPDSAGYEPDALTIMLAAHII